MKFCLFCISLFSLQSTEACFFFCVLNYIQTTYNDCQLSEVRQKSGRFYVQLVLLSQATGYMYVSRGNLSAFDIIGSNARGTAGNNIFTTGNKKSCPSQHCTKCSFAPYSTHNGVSDRTKFKFNHQRSLFVLSHCYSNSECSHRNLGVNL